MAEENKKTKEETKNKKTKEEEKYILFDLFNESNIDYNLKIMRLSKNNLLEQYRKELQNKFLRVPTITKKQFNKIIGDS